MKDWNIRIQLGAWGATVPIHAATAKEAHQKALDHLNTIASDKEKIFPSYSLLEIYTLYEEEKYHEFCKAVIGYGASDFARDIETDENGEGQPVNTPEDCYNMLATFVIFTQPSTEKENTQ